MFTWQLHDHQTITWPSPDHYLALISSFKIKKSCMVVGGGGGWWWWVVVVGQPIIQTLPQGLVLKFDVWRLTLTLTLTLTLSLTICPNRTCSDSKFLSLTYSFIFVFFHSIHVKERLWHTLRTTLISELLKYISIFSNYSFFDIMLMNTPRDCAHNLNPNLFEIWIFLIPCPNFLANLWLIINTHTFQNEHKISCLHSNDALMFCPISK